MADALGVCRHAAREGLQHSSDTLDEEKKQTQIDNSHSHLLAPFLHQQKQPFTSTVVLTDILVTGIGWADLDSEWVRTAHSRLMSALVGSTGGVPGAQQTRRTPEPSAALWS
jgi:hypothetical protein